MKKHRLRLSLGKEIARDPGIVGAQKRFLRDRLLRWALGPLHEVTIVVPGKSVKQIDIKEVDDISCTEVDHETATR